MKYSTKGSVRRLQYKLSKKDVELINKALPLLIAKVDANTDKGIKEIEDINSTLFIINN